MDSKPKTDAYTIADCREDMLRRWSFHASNPGSGIKDFLAQLDAAERKRWIRMANNCPCCHYDHAQHPTDLFGGCKSCPIKWPNGKCNPGEYIEWRIHRVTFPDLSVMYAKRIYNLALQIEVNK